MIGKVHHHGGGLFRRQFPIDKGGKAGAVNLGLSGH
jgi:hypothetical protein